MALALVVTLASTLLPIACCSSRAAAVGGGRVAFDLPAAGDDAAYYIVRVLCCVSRCDVRSEVVLPLHHFRYISVSYTHLTLPTTPYV